MNNVTVQLQDVCKEIKGKKIIKNVSFDVYEGEVFGFLGPNGAGKTTTIRMMVGLMGISSGDIKIAGYSIKENFEKAVQQVGAIVENPEMYKFLSGYSNLKQYARMIPGITEERIEAVIELVGLEKRIKEKVKTYSLGMRQRLGIAQALLHEPKVLILDEPTNGLDPAGIREIRDYLRRLAREEGMTVIVSSHLLSEMELMCDRVGIIQQGELLDIQSIKDFVHDDSTLYELQVTPVEEALSILHSMDIEATIVKNKLHASIERDNMPEVISLLVEKKISIYEVREQSKTLEEKFLEKTSSKKGA
ncbi:ABC transporter ATP-binding protein [Sutcliffiella cohnii]|uniref:Bacitracin ABC transporter ATP-binding protein n=1 Tax=Sutcliffiella cohnii TaxID=33932 RepID=A0A223KPY3_9BACI|nr:MULTISPECIES: ABC transporter ATP-binding protein [Sutcliffiella]AST91466.1 bacitracin ABC transporter ATP-binding protein [Sutcliffiella cohnii]MED4014971.1 ABC transporter ATP-binding protein [Sutcliffiella cohnii]WBL17296.1 ABC transporter ATP-binding protein [Sutcliffiella sp. NC1]